MCKLNEKPNEKQTNAQTNKKTNAPVVFEQVDAVEALVAAPTLVLLLGVHGQVGVKGVLVTEGSLALRAGLQVVHVYYVVTEIVWFSVCGY